MLAEQRHIGEGVKLLPRDALRVGEPVLVAARVAAGRLTFVEQSEVGRLRTRLQLGQLVGVIGLDAEVVDAAFAAARRDREVDPRVVEHPFGVVDFMAGRLGGEELRIEGDALVEVVDMDVNVKAFHGGFSGGG